jgi:diaminopimelate decarboxylase
MSSNYNSLPLVPEIMLDDGSLTVIRKRQSIEHLPDLEIKGEPF